MTLRHFLREDDLTADEFKAIIKRASLLKKEWQSGVTYEPLKNRTLAMIFEKSSTRTRVSFEAGMTQLGGHAIHLSSDSSQLGRGEPMEDTAKVLSEMVDAVMIRTFSQQALERFAKASRIPVINGLTDFLHPCQMLADMQTWFDHRGDIAGKIVCWVGDGNNMCNSYINLAKLLDFELRIACPVGYEPDPELLKSAGTNAHVSHSPIDACRDANLIVTDVWASMGQESERKQRERAFADYCVNDRIMAAAASDALFMHCLPAHRSEEVSASVIDGAQSVVWEEAGNRMHAQKSLLEFLLVGPSDQ
ncbi:MAG: ornithine carbamoyltransferase [Gammaproteobacteria bacterium]|nr:ornithine carbamoyltransferase [Gammaproteobacteria bacterium]